MVPIRRVLFFVAAAVTLGHKAFVEWMLHLINWYEFRVLIVSLVEHLTFENDKARFGNYV